MDEKGNSTRQLVCAITAPPVPEREVVRKVVLRRLREARWRLSGACEGARRRAGARGRCCRRMKRVGALRAFGHRVRRARAFLLEESAQERAAVDRALVDAVVDAAGGCAWRRYC